MPRQASSFFIACYWCLLLPLAPQVVDCYICCHKVHTPNEGSRGMYSSMVRSLLWVCFTCRCLKFVFCFARHHYSRYPPPFAVSSCKSSQLISDKCKLGFVFVDTSQLLLLSSRNSSRWQWRSNIIIIISSAAHTVIQFPH